MEAILATAKCLALRFLSMGSGMEMFQINKRKKGHVLQYRAMGKKKNMFSCLSVGYETTCLRRKKKRYERQRGNKEGENKTRNNPLIPIVKETSLFYEKEVIIRTNQGIDAG